MDQVACVLGQSGRGEGVYSQLYIAQERRGHAGSGIPWFGCFYLGAPSGSAGLSHTSTHPLLPGTVRVLVHDGLQALHEDLTGILRVGEDRKAAENERPLISPGTCHSLPPSDVLCGLPPNLGKGQALAIPCGNAADVEFWGPPQKMRGANPFSLRVATSTIF